MAIQHVSVRAALLNADGPYRELVHELIDPHETRPMLCAWLDRVRPLLTQLLGPVKFTMKP